MHEAAYDVRTDTLSIILKADAAVAESDEDKPGVILDYDRMEPDISRNPGCVHEVTEARRSSSRRRAEGRERCVIKAERIIRPCPARQPMSRGRAGAVRCPPSGRPTGLEPEPQPGN